MCTFTNTKHASLTVVKVTDPASDPQDFDFDLTGSGVPADLDLDTDAGNATLPSQDSFSLNASQLGAHTVTESAVAGWDLTALECTGAGGDSSTNLGTRAATLDIDAGETVVCTFTNTKHASLTVVKVTDPASDPQDFDFDLTGSGVPADLDLDTDGGNATLPSQDSFSLNASQLGAHSVTESVTPGWALTALECTGAGGDSSTSVGTRSATLDIDAGETVVCTFTNTKSASLTVVKVTDPASDPQDFDFDLTGSAVPADLDLDTDAGNATLASQETFPVSAAQLGAYTVTESALAGWDLTALECTGAGGDSSTSLGTRAATLDIDAGETVVCTFTNTKHASLTVVKVTDPASDPQDFDFDLTGSGVPADLDLDTDAGNATLPSQDSFSLNASQLGAHSVTESALAGWTLTDLECTGAGGDSSTSLANRAATLDIDAGETVVCTFTNTKHASLTVVKVTDPASDPQDFDFDLTGSGVPADLDLDTDAGDATLPSQDSFSLNASQLGAHTVTESAVAGWDLTALECTGAGGDSSTNLGTRAATLDIDAGETVVCTFTNTKHASLTVVKVTDPASDPQDFDFDLTGSGVPADLDLDTDAGNATLPSQDSFSLDASELGAHTVTESAVAGWDLTALECTGAGGDSSTNLGDRAATLDIDAGETVVCTFTNTKRASLTVVKVTDPASDPQDFDFDLTGSGVPADLDLDTDAGNATLPSQESFPLTAAQLGAHTVTETAQAGWTLTALECTGAGGDSSTNLGDRAATLDIDAGETVVCTFTNKKDATVTVIKDAVPNAAQDFAFTTTGSQLSGFSLDDDADGTLSNTKVFTVSGAGFGEKTVSESAVAGWSLTDITCSEGSDAGNTATIQVDPGDAITCTFTNKQDATVTIVKDAVPNAAQDFAFTTTGAGLSGFSLDDDADGTLSNTKVFTVSGADFGQKTVSESAVAGWSLTDITCSEGSDAGNDGDDPGRSGRHDHVHVHEQAGRDGHRDQGRDPERSRELLVHDERSGRRLRSRRRRRRDVVEQQDDHGVGRGLRSEDGDRDGGAGLGSDRVGVLGG